MKKKKLPWLLWLTMALAWLVGCGTTPEPQAEIELTAVVAQLPTVVPTAQLPTETPIPTATATPTVTPIPTETLDLSFLETPIPPSPTPRPLATLDPALSPPTGQVVFLWSAKPPLDGPDIGYTTNLYTIEFTKQAPNQWEPKILLPDLLGAVSISMSVDENKLAILFSPDEESVWFGGRMPGIYDIESRSWETLGDGSSGIYSFDWMPDNKTVIYNLYASLFSLNAESGTSEFFKNSVDENLHGITISPNGQSLALISKQAWPTPNPLSILDIESQSLTEIPSSELLFSGPGEMIAWSPDNQWVLFSAFERDLTLINTTSSEVTKLVESETVCSPAWSPTTAQLAYTCNGILYLWSADSQTSVELLRQEALGPPVWSPDGTTILASFTEGEESGFVSIEVESMIKRWMPLETSLHPAISFAPLLSPDGNWLLFVSDGDDSPMIYLLSMLSLDAYFIFSIEDNALPSDFYWSGNS